MEDYEGDALAVARIRWVTKMVRVAKRDCKEQITNAKLIADMKSMIEN